MKYNLYNTLLVVCFFLVSFANSQSVINLNAEEFKALLLTESSVLLDVRTPEETSSGQLENASTINFYDSDFESKLRLIQKNKSVFVYCRSGSRSSKAAKLLIELGQYKVFNLNGGIGAWRKSGFQVTKPSDLQDDSIQSLTTTEFKSLLQTNKLVLADFHTQWCVPCKNLVPIIEELEIEFVESTTFLRIDVDSSKALSDAFKVVAVPTLLLFKNTELIWSNTGFMNKEELRSVLLQYR